MDAVPEKALVAEAGGMGAPTVGIEKLDAYECEAALRGHFKGGGFLLFPELISQHAALYALGAVLHCLPE